MCKLEIHIIIWCSWNDGLIIHEVEYKNIIVLSEHQRLKVEFVKRTMDSGIWT